MSFENWKDAYHKRYAELKAQGKSFFPYIVAKDLVVCAAIFFIVAGLALFYGAHLEDLADPTDNTYNPRPEWYFLFMYELLKYFPGSWEPIAAVVLPTVGIGALLFLPFLDGGPKRHPLDRKGVVGAGLAALAAVIYLGIQGYRSPLTNPVVKHDPAVLEGKRMYRELRCQYCHSIGGRGGVVGPELDTIGSRRNRDWLVDHFRNPQKLKPGSAMPNFGLLDQEIEGLVSYMSSLGGGAYTTDAPRLFTEHCASCHRIGKEGEDSGPDLSRVGQYREPAWLAEYLKDPAKMNKDAAMPGFAETLTPAQIEDLARYLAAQRGGAPKGTPKP